MPAIETISQAEVRQIMLATQGFGASPLPSAEKPDVLRLIRQMGVLQIDSINVIARSPYLVLWSRLGDYNPAWLDELLAEGALFEYWAHAMCFVPIEDFPIYRRSMLEGARFWEQVQRWINEHAAVTAMVLERIRQEGGLRSADFKDRRKPAGGWWNWRDEKTALEFLIMQGELMVARRQNFQRVYELRSRILPDWDDGPELANVPSREEVQQLLALRAVRALGAARADWVPDYYRQYKTGNAQRLEALAEAGSLRRVQIEGLPGPAYMDPAAPAPQPMNFTTVLSPFDPIVWDRQRLKELHNFDYTIEVYTPAHKRSFGYYTMPILHNGRIVGRLDPKAHRADGVFEVKAIALEPGVEATDELAAGLRTCLQRLAEWHCTPELVIRRVEPEGLAKRLSSDF
jgi:uncharacterized protein YcaQ